MKKILSYLSIIIFILFPTIIYAEQELNYEENPPTAYEDYYDDLFEDDDDFDYENYDPSNPPEGTEFVIIEGGHTTNYKTQYLVGEAFDYSSIIAYLMDETEMYYIEVSYAQFNEYGITVSCDFNNQKEGSQTVSFTLTYKDSSDTSSIFVKVISENHNYPTKMGLISAPSEWKENDYTGFLFQVEYEDGTYKNVYYNSNDFRIVSDWNELAFYYKDPDRPNYNDELFVNIILEDHRIYDNESDSTTYYLESDYDIHNQEVYDLQDEYPEQYDLRDQIDIKVENQGEFGLCWDYALTTALETTYNLKYDENVELSESYIDYMTSNLMNGDRELHDGGWAYNYYNEAIKDGVPTLKEVPNREYSEDEYDLIIDSDKEVLPTAGITIQLSKTLLSSSNEIVNKMIKDHLLNYGAVGMSYAFYPEYYKDETNTFYLPVQSMGYTTQYYHMVAIIGWDDTISKEVFRTEALNMNTEYDYFEPSQDGAWIVLNSWGDEFGENGILYISYESFTKELFGFLDAEPYYKRNNYTYVDNQYEKPTKERTNLGEVTYIYVEYDVNSDNEYLNDIVISEHARGKVYYIDDYEDLSTADLSNIREIGDFSLSKKQDFSPYNTLGNQNIIDSHIFLDNPIKINGDKFALIVELKSKNVPLIKYYNDDEIRTYYTKNTISNDMVLSTGNFPIHAYTITKFEPQNDLPLVIIRVDERQFKIDEQNEKDTDHVYGTLEDVNDSIDHSVRGLGTVEIILPEGYESEYGSNIIPLGEMELDYIRGRGNVTWLSSKKPYKIKYAKKQNILGMGANKEWALLANSMDKTLLHNAIAMNVASEFGIPYTIQMVPVEVIIISNSGTTFMGSYYLSELVDIGSGRIDLPEIGKNATNVEDGSYLISIYYEPQDSDKPQTTIFEASTSGLQFMNETPNFETEDLSEGQIKQRDYIRNIVNEIDELIVGSETIDKETHDKIDSLMDLKSTADYWLVQEFFINFDAYKTSSNYLYKEPGENGKLYWGPLWDFDLIYFWVDNEPEKATGFNNYNPNPWLDTLRDKDPYFFDLLKVEWAKLDPIIEDVIRDGGTLDQYKERIRSSWETNYDMWLVEDYPDLDLDELVETLREILIFRRNWFNENIENIGNAYYTVTYTIDNEVVRVDKVRAESVLEIDLKPEKEGCFFNYWMDTTTKEDVSNQKVYSDLVLEPNFFDPNEIEDEIHFFLSTYEDWALLEDELYENSPKIYPEDYYEILSHNLIWESSNPGVAIYSDEDNMIKLLSVGDTTFNVILFNGDTLSFLLHVYDSNTETLDEPDGILLEKDTYILEVGEYDQIIYTFNPNKPYSSYIDVYREVENEDIVFVDYSGCFVIQGLEVGTTTVTLTLYSSYRDDYYGTQTVTVIVVPSPIVVSANEQSNEVTEEVKELISKVNHNEEVEGIDEELANIIRKAILDNKEITIELSITKIEDTNTEELNKIKESLSSNTNIIEFYDIRINVIIDNEIVGNITKLNNNIKIALDIPNDLPELQEGYERVYKVVTMHNNVIKVLDYDNFFSNNEFSPYVLTYEDVIKKNDSGEKNPYTNDYFVYYLLLSMIGFIGLIISIILIKEV